MTHEHKKIKSDLIESDIELIRLLEDLVEVLIMKGVINYTDLPHAAMQKLLKRQRLRNKLINFNPLNKMDTEE